MGSKKKLMILGASRVQLPPIQYAKAAGYHVIACDMNPESVGKQYVDEFYPVSTTDLDAVLSLAEKCRIDGIVTYTADAAAPTVAYVGNKLGLPSNPYESVLTLARKDAFRKFLKENNYYTPKAGVYSTWQSALEEIEDYTFPVLVKPCDSAGSRGVVKLSKEEITSDSFKKIFDKAQSFSRANKVVIEGFVQRKKYQVAGDGFAVGGELVFRCFANEHFNTDCNPLVPIGESFPWIFDENTQQRAHDYIQSIFTKLDFEFGAFNFDFMITEDDDVFVIEIGPRNGGNLIPQVTRYATGVDMVEYTIKAAMGEDCSDLKMVSAKGYHASYMIHSKTGGSYGGLEVKDSLKGNILEHHMYIQPGEQVEAFNMAGHAIGEMILKFDSEGEMLEKMDHMEKYMQVKLA